MLFTLFRYLLFGLLPASLLLGLTHTWYVLVQHLLIGILVLLPVPVTPTVRGTWQVEPPFLPPLLCVRSRGRWHLYATCFLFFMTSTFSDTVVYCSMTDSGHVPYPSVSCRVLSYVLGVRTRTFYTNSTLQYLRLWSYMDPVRRLRRPTVTVPRFVYPQSAYCFTAAYSTKWSTCKTRSHSGC